MQLEPRFRHTANIYTAISKHKEVIVIGGESFDGYCDSVLIFKGLGNRLILQQQSNYSLNSQ
jgi:hypothetical protein